MKEQFSEEYFFIQEVIHYLRNGNKAQQEEYKEKLRSRYEEYVRGLISKKIIIKYQLKEDAINEFFKKLYDAEYLATYRGDASFRTYIYKQILAAIRIVMPESEEAKDKKRQEKNRREREKRAQKKNANNVSNKDQAIYLESTKKKNKNLTKAQKYTEDDGKQYLHSSTGEKALHAALEESTFTRRDNQEHLLGIKDLRAKLDQAIAVSILKMSKIHPKDIRIFVMNLCEYSWEEIAECVGTDADGAKKRYNRKEGIQDKFSSLLIKTLWDKYKIDFQTVSGNFNALLDVE